MRELNIPNVYNSIISQFLYYSIKSALSKPDYALAALNYYDHCINLFHSLWHLSNPFIPHPYFEWKDSLYIYTFDFTTAFDLIIIDERFIKERLFYLDE